MRAFFSGVNDDDEGVAGWSADRLRVVELVWFGEDIVVLDAIDGLSSINDTNDGNGTNEEGVIHDASHTEHVTVVPLL
jgi:hypothetical protein